jgi:NitT/TauT family transport system substrate-binding protein
MIAYIKALRVYNDALKDGGFKGPAAKEVVDILIKETKIKDPQLYAKMVPNGLHPDGKVNMASLEKDHQFFKEQGFLEGKSTVTQIVDNSFADNALKVLGPYKPQQ